MEKRKATEYLVNPVSRAEVRKQRTEDRKQRSDDRRLKSEVGIWKSEGLEDRRQVLFLLNQLIQPCQLNQPHIPETRNMKPETRNP